MKNNYKFHTAVLLCLLGYQGINAQTTTTTVERTKQVLTFGDWKAVGEELGLDTSKIPTGVKDFYYNHKGQLVQTLESQMLLKDDANTFIQVEKLGDKRPVVHTDYEYDENDCLSAVIEKKYGSTNGWFYNWSANDTLQVFAYNEAKQLINKQDSVYRHEYIWQGQQLTAEKQFQKANGNLVAAHYYSAFVGETNLPQKVVVAHETAEDCRFEERFYNEEQQLNKCVTYALANPKTDEQGKVIDGEKGKAIEQIEYAYSNGALTTETHSVWDEAQNLFVPASKKEIKFVEEKGGYETLNYTYNNETWNPEGDPVLEIKGNYYLNAPIAEITAEASTVRANSVIVKFYAPEEADENATWSIFRNGEEVGKPTLLEGEWVFTDNELPNGDYDYYAMCDSQIDQPVSNVAKFHADATLVAVNQIKVLESGKLNSTEGENGYTCNIIWNTPNTKNTVLGYNIYVDPAADDPQPTRFNSKLLLTPYFELPFANADQLEHQIVIETVYAQGCIKSLPSTIVLDPAHEVKSQRIANVSQVVYFGNSMGTKDETSRSKVDINYYNANHQLVMTVTNGYSDGDDPDTPEIEHLGDFDPINYIIYDYNEKNQLIRERSREYGVFSGYDRAWNPLIKEETAYSYDENTGKVSSMIETGSKHFDYIWEGDRLVTTKIFSVRSGKKYALAVINYSDFVENQENKPRYALSYATSSTTSYNRVYEYEYDAQGRKIAERAFKHGSNIEKDADGNIISVDKGQPVEEILWEYEGQYLKRILKNKWSYSDKALVPYSKTEYTQTANGVREEGYSWMNYPYSKGWSKSSIVKETATSSYFTGTAPGTLTATDIEGRVNSVHLSCAMPSSEMGENITYKVFRNGKKIGVAKPDGEGNVVYDDFEVANGVWHYIIQPSGNGDGVRALASNVLEKVFNTPLPPAENVAFPINGKNEKGEYELLVTWEAPQTDLKIIGYNVFEDIRSYTKNPSPVNGLQALPANTNSYKFNWSSLIRMDKTFAIEVVYNIGKIKTENIPVTINETPTGIATAQTSDRLSVVGNDVLVNGTYQSLEVFATNGTCVAQGNGNQRVQLSHLPQGIYLIKLVTNQGTETLKMVKK